MQIDWKAADAAIDRWREGKEPVSGSAWELREVVAEAARLDRIDVVLEIGSHAGDSLRIWQESFRPSLIVGCEVEDSERTRNGLDPLIRNGANIVFRGSDTPEGWTEIKTLLGGRGVDFLYIDGDHHYMAAKADFYTYAPLVRPGGLIVLDDPISTWTAEIEVHKLVPEIRVQFRTKLIAGCADIRTDDLSAGKLVVYAPDYLTLRDDALNNTRTTCVSAA